MGYFLFFLKNIGCACLFEKYFNFNCKHNYKQTAHIKMSDKIISTCYVKPMKHEKFYADK